MSDKASKYVIYCRVSTDEQGRSGLGLEAQQAACEQYVAAQEGVVLRSFVEVASGDDDCRPHFAAAIKLARRAGATLVVSKLDRMSRAVATIAGLMRDGLAFRVAEIASASELELHLRAVISQEERRAIASRTKAALGAAKARGKLLGSARPGHWVGREHLRDAGLLKARAKASSVRKAANADLFAEARPIIEASAGETLRAVAARLEAAGVMTPMGSTTWSPTAVKRLRLALSEKV